MLKVTIKFENFCYLEYYVSHFTWEYPKSLFGSQNCTFSSSCSEVDFPLGTVGSYLGR
jgi:hypothetical protein